MIVRVKAPRRPHGLECRNGRTSKSGALMRATPAGAAETHFVVGPTSPGAFVGRVVELR